MFSFRCITAIFNWHVCILPTYRSELYICNCNCTLFFAQLDYNDVVKESGFSASDSWSSYTRIMPILRKLKSYL